MPDAMKPSSPFPRLLLIGLVFHLVFIGSVFDCYFTSPVVHGMQHFATEAPEAKRLVLIVGDGLRADLLFGQDAFRQVTVDAPKLVAPHLHGIAERRGAFGISHTRVPTESRPGHVALIGGMYEDVSAVTKGWKTNPVDFDCVFNQSSSTFSFGSPDILPMFSRGATPGKVKTWCYDEEFEDFTKDATALDKWVFDHLRSLLHNATTDRELDSQLRGDKVVFFLHLLGLDTTGHSYRPHSKEYMNNIRVVDDIVRQTEELISSFYGDADTAYVFTADHGMSQIGNHGDGHPDNTRTPLIAWGKGVRGPLPDTSPSTHDDYSASWGLSHLYRRDVEQADVASLMSTLLGTAWPVNSVGVLPDVDPMKLGYLDMRDGERARASAAVVNAKVLLEHYRVKHDIKRSTSLSYKPYTPLEGRTAADLPGVTSIAAIEQLIHDHSYIEALERSSALIRTTLEGLRYLQTYDRLLIQAIVTAAYLGWIAYGATHLLLPPSSLTAPASSPLGVLPAAVVLLVAWVLFALQHAPGTYYVYIAFPVFFWHQSIALGFKPWNEAVRSGRIALADVLRWALRAAGVVLALMAMAAGYTNRSIWGYAFGLLAAVWPISAWPSSMHASHTPFWAAACFTIKWCFTASNNMEESLYYLIMGGFFMMLLGATGIIPSTRKFIAPKDEPVPTQHFMIQLGLIASSVIITVSSVHHLRAKTGLPLVNQVAGWTTLAFSLIYPLLACPRHPSAYSKLLSIVLTFGPLFIILSISVEPLFYLAFSGALVAWVEAEVTLRAGSAPPRVDRDEKAEVAASLAYVPRADDLRIALFFLLFVQAAFFGFGNVASMSSFYLAPVYRLVPIFSPFLMAALLILKIIAPYVVLSAAFAILNRRLGLPPFSLFLVALTLTDVMTLVFFFNVRDTGSWLQIGESITFFVISSLLLVWSAGVCAAGELLIGDGGVPVAMRQVKTQ